MTDKRAELAANNNADWYTMMFDIHGLRYERSAAAFLAIDHPPPYHSGVVVTAPGRSEAIVALIPTAEQQPRFGIKDSFSELTFEDLELVELFAASWLWADQVPKIETAGWERIERADHLDLWEAAWNDGGSPSDKRQFPPKILTREDVAIFGRRAGDGFDAGVIANRSVDCVGLSNAFGPAESYAAAACCCAEFGGGVPVVGYERGDDLVSALTAGFEVTGRLRVAYRPFTDQ